MSYIEQLLDCIDKVPKAKASFQGLDDQARTELAELRRLTPQPVGDVVNNLYGVDEMLAEITRLRGLIGELIPFISTVVDNGYQDTSAGTRMSTKCKACDTVYYSIASNKSTEIWECTNPDCPAGRAREVAG